MKAIHESNVSNILDQGQSPSKGDVASKILHLLEANHQVWKQYGPKSQLARTRPHCEAAHAVWISERLSIIVPNNRKIKRILTNNLDLFASEERELVKQFLVHVRSYEKWVHDEIPYSAVLRFPQDFSNLMGEIADGGT